MKMTPNYCVLQVLHHLTSWNYSPPHVDHGVGVLVPLQQIHEQQIHRFHTSQVDHGVEVFVPLSRFMITRSMDFIPLI